MTTAFNILIFFVVVLQKSNLRDKNDDKNIFSMILPIDFEFNTYLNKVSS